MKDRFSKCRLPSSSAHLKFAWHSLWQNQSSSLKSLRGPSEKLIFSDSGAQSVTLTLSPCIYLLSAISEAWPYLHIRFSTKGHFNPNTSSVVSLLTHSLNDTVLRRDMKGALLTLFFPNNSESSRAPPHPPLEVSSNKWLTEKHSGHSLPDDRSGNLRLFSGCPLSLEIPF